MNILISNDDGPEAEGLALLRNAARKTFPASKLMTLVPKLGRGGQGLSITPVAPEELKVERLAADFYVVEGTPADCMYVGLGTPRRFLPSGQFDLVLTGVNHGQNVGMDVFHSGTVGMAMLAFAFFGVRAIALSQEMEYGHTEAEMDRFHTASRYLPALLEDMSGQRSCCQSVNFPLQREPKGWQVCGVSMFSRFRPHLAVENKREDQDVAQLERGYITISVLEPTMLGLEARSREDPLRVLARQFHSIARNEPLEVDS